MCPCTWVLAQAQAHALCCSDIHVHTVTHAHMLTLQDICPHACMLTHAPCRVCSLTILATWPSPSASPSQPRLPLGSSGCLGWARCGGEVVVFQPAHMDPTLGAKTYAGFHAVAIQTQAHSVPLAEGWVGWGVTRPCSSCCRSVWFWFLGGLWRVAVMGPQASPYGVYGVAGT